MEHICKEINNNEIFSFYKDGAFIVKSFIFEDIDLLLSEESNNLKILESDYRRFCIENDFNFIFDELISFILAQKIDLFTDKKTSLLDLSYAIPKYIEEKMRDDSIFKIINNIYLGSIISSYLELKISSKVTKSELLLDTNFFISLIDLNTEDSYHICKQLFDLCSQFGFRFTILNSTVNQIRILLGNRISDFKNKDFIGSVRGADIFNACIRRNLDKTNLERIKDSVPKILDELEIVVLQDQQVKYYIEKAKKSSEYKDLLKKRQYNEESALNDCVAKLYVDEKRGKSIQEFADVKCWFLHNSYSPYQYRYGYKIQDRYSISANELLILLWLASPSQNKNINIDTITKSGLASYITKYRRAKAPAIKTLKHIKQRANLALSTGDIEENDIYNLCIRMAEGYLAQEQAEELTDTELGDIEFAQRLKGFTKENENLKRKLTLQEYSYKKENERLNEKVTAGEEQIALLNSRIYKIEKEKYVGFRIKKSKQYTYSYLILIIVIISLWIINRFFASWLNDLASSIIAFLVFICTTFVLRFIDHVRIKEFFFNQKSRERLEKEYDDNHKGSA